MRRTPRWSFPIGLAVSLCAAPCAQHESTSTAAARGAGIAASTAAFAGVSDLGGGLMAVGRSYRATFDARAVTFQPALGKEGKQAVRWRCETVRCTRGGLELLRAGDCIPTRSHDRRQATFHHPGIDERYVARPDGLKQSFVFSAPPAGFGELVVELAIDCNVPRAGDGSLRWTAADGGGVTFGEVVGIDANGTRCAGRARATATGLELALPDWFVDQAAYPLELDPLIGTVQSAFAGVDIDFPDVAYDAYSDSWCVVWTQFLANGSTGVVGSVWDADTMALGYAFGLNQAGDEDSIRVTNIAGSGLYVLVWTNYTGSTATISGLALEPTQAQATNIFPIDGPAGVYAPIVSGEATLFDDDCLVCWLDDTFGLLGRSIAIDANMQVSGTPIVQIAGGNVTEAAISKQGGNQGLHVVTWIDRPPGLPGWVRAQVVDHDLNLLGPGAWIQNTPQGCGLPAVDGDGFKFLVAWEEQRLTNPSAVDVRGRIVTVGTTGITTLGGTLDLAGTPAREEYAVDVARLGDHFGVTYMGPAGTLQYGDDCWFRAVSGVGAPIGAELRLELVPGTQYRYEHTPRLIGRIAGDATLNVDDGLLVFADQNVTTFDSDVGMQQIEAIGPGGAIVDRGGGCGPGGIASSPGPVALGNPTLALELFGAQPLAVPFLFLGVPAPLLSCGVCSVIQPLSVTFVPNTAGSASWPFPIPGTATLVGFAFDFQFVSFNVLYVGCPSLPGVAASNIVRATIDY
jgi:hypothetical protein